MAPLALRLLLLLAFACGTTLIYYPSPAIRVLLEPGAAAPLVLARNLTAGDGLTAGATLQQHSATLPWAAALSLYSMDPYSFAGVSNLDGALAPLAFPADLTQPITLALAPTGTH